MESFPLYVSLTFGATVLLTIWLFLKACGYSRRALILIAIWTAVQSILGIAGFYNDVTNMTTRFPLLIIPPVILIIILFATKAGRAFIDSLNPKFLTLVHIIRIPVEIVLFWLFTNHGIPEAMTFEGRNFDILSGLTAPLIYYFGFVNHSLNKTVIIIWNLLCVGLLLNVVSSAVLSLPGRFQNFGFEQPNIAIGYFPFLLLPALLVPIVLFANLASVRKCLVQLS